jgi:molecular chaperone DnaK (HSP70)
MDEMNDLIVGIDLGTTNSEVAAFIDGQVRIITSGNRSMLPSVVGLSPSGDLLVGEPARNQLMLYPERTVRSIKRKMGSNETVSLGDRPFTPPEVSALILRELASWASRQFGRPVTKAVITVPAYFSDAQRQATREAASLAGLEAVRILNEPTAASLAYGEGSRHTAMVYDLGGGTFDVSIVALEGDVTEVLASHGNNHLGGDDFNDLLAEHLFGEFQSQHGIDLRSGGCQAPPQLRPRSDRPRRSVGHRRWQAAASGVGNHARAV